MRSIWHFFSDPTLHLVAIALFLTFLTFSNSRRSRELAAESPLPLCSNCRTHFLPGTPCECNSERPYARAALSGN